MDSGRPEDRPFTFTRRQKPGLYPTKKWFQPWDQVKGQIHVWLIPIFLAFLFFMPAVSAAVNLQVTPITWNTIGLNSNDVNVGPQNFPVGVRVTNTGDSVAPNIKAEMIWDTPGVDPYINLRPGSQSTLSASGLAPGSYQDFYFEAQVTRTTSAFDKTRRYHVVATAYQADGVTPIVSASSPQPRELYVEHLVSQGRNGVSDILLNGTSIPAGGTMNLVVGNTYTLTLVGFTATQGYGQLEGFLYLPNTIFQILSVSTDYSANTSPSISSTNYSRLYADACGWENDPNSPAYRSCTGSDYKTGGTVVTDYTIRVIGGGGSSETITTLLLDFSGSSYHCNSDYSVGGRIANIIDPTAVTITKKFSPNPTNVNGVSTLTFTLTNPNAGTLEGLNFTDSLPANMKVASTPAASTSGLGTPTFGPAANDTTLSFSGGTLAPNGTGTISVNVTTTSTGTYSNTTNHLFVGTQDTNQTASASLTVNTSPAPGSGVCGVTLAQWTFDGFTTNPPPYPSANVKAADVSTASISVGGTAPGSLTAEADSTTGSPASPSMLTYGWPKTGPIVTSTYPYVQFAIDTSKYTSIQVQFAATRKANGPNNDALYYSTDGATWNLVSTFTSTTSWATFGPYSVAGASTTGTTYFRIYGYGANATSRGNDFNLDQVTFTGCGSPAQPTITKSFSPSSIPLNGTSTLTFTLTNPNGTALTGAKFRDVLPDGLQVASIPGASAGCGGSWSPASGDTVLNYGQTAGGTIPANGTCQIKVNVVATTTGPHTNVSEFLSTTEGGTNTSSVATATLTALLPPVISKHFSPNPILPNGVSTLTFIVTNPNQNDSLSGIAFTDALPTSPGSMVVASTPSASVSGFTGTPTFSPTAGSGSLSFSNGTLAPGATGIVSVDITAPSTGSYGNTSSDVTTLIGGTTVTGNKASDTLTVNAPNPAISVFKQVSTSSSGPWYSFLAVPAGTPLYYRFTIENIGDVPLSSSLGVNDPLLAGTSADPALCLWASPLPVATSTVDPTQTSVTGPISAQSGSITNTATSYGHYGGTQYNSLRPSEATYSTTGLTLAKSASESSFNSAGDLIHYSYTVTNSGSAPLEGPVTVSDNKVPVTCQDVNLVGDLDNFLDPGESVTGSATYTVTAADVTAAYVTNTATAFVSGVTSNTSTATVLAGNAIDLSVTKTDGSSSYSPSAPITYTITVTNGGPSTVGSLTLTDAVPAAIEGVTWTPSSGSYNPATGAWTGLNLAPAGTVTMTVSGTVSASATGNLVNTATVTPPSGIVEVDPADNSSTDTDTVTLVADLSLAKTDHSLTYTPGSSVSYDLTVTNNGPSSISACTLVESLPAALHNVTFTPSAGSYDSGTGAWTGLSLGSGQSVTLTVGGTVDGFASGNLLNSATVSAPPGVTDNVPANNTDTDTDTPVVVSDLSVTKTDGRSTYTQGDSIQYTITLTNNGPSSVSSCTLTESLPAYLSGISSTPSEGSYDSGTGAWTGLSLSSGQSATLRVDGTVSASASGNLVNSVSVTPPSGVTDPDSGNNTATDTDTYSAVADLSITKTDGKATYTPGTGITYTIVVANAGPSPVSGATVSDSLPASISGATWTATGTGGAGFTASGSGSISQSIDLPVGSTVTYTLTGTVSSGTSGNLANTASVAVPADVTDPIPANNSSTDTDTPSAISDLSITKTNGSTSYTPGASVTYTIVAGNAGPSDAVGVTVMDTIPPSLTGVTWTATGTGGATFSGSGSISETVDLPAGSSITYTLTGMTSDSESSSLSNTASIAAPADVTDPTPGNNTATDTDPASASADLSITKTDGQTAYSPGSSVTYTVTVHNAGPSAVSGATVTDTLPGTISGASWTATGSAGTTFGNNGSGSISETVSLAAGGSITYTITGTVSPMASGTLSNTATVAVPAAVADPNPSNNSATDTDLCEAQADLSITKTSGSGSYTPGSPITYTVTVLNNGPASVSGATVSDILPASISGASWTALGSGGASFTPSGTGNITQTVDLPAGSSITYTLTGTVSPSATGNLSNTATVSVPAGVSDPDPSDNSSTVTTMAAPHADLSISKTDGSSVHTPGTSITYAITVTNHGPSSVVGATVTDLLPPVLSGVSWTATGTSGTVFSASGSGDLHDTVSMPSGSSIMYTLTGMVASSATGTLSNTATVAAPSGVTDSTPANNSATDTDTFSPLADLSIFKTDGIATYVPGGTLTYTVTVGNAGPSQATGALVSDTLPAAITGATWTASGTPGCSYVASGAGNLAETVTIPSGGSIVYTMLCTLSGTASGNLTNTATISLPAGISDPVPENNSSTDTDTSTPGPSADLSITKTDAHSTYTPGSPVTYTIVASNQGPDAVTGAMVTDTLPGSLTGASWTAVTTGGATCTTSGSGNISQSVNMPSGSTITYTLSANVSSSASGNLSNTAAVSAPSGVVDPNTGNNQATDTDTPTSSADLTIAKTDGNSAYTPGANLTYVITVTNNGPSSVTGATVSDTVPGILTGVTWTAIGTAGTVYVPSGTGNILQTVDMPSESAITYTVSGHVSADASGILNNTATVTPPGGTTDPIPGNNSATDTDTSIASADLSIAKTDGTAEYIPGVPQTYTVTVTNSGPSAVVGATVTDTMPAALNDVTWTAVGTGGTGFVSSGTGSIHETVTLPSGSTIVYTVTGTVAPSASGNLTNTATVAVPANVEDPRPGNNSATDVDTPSPRADLSITKTDGNTVYTPGATITYVITARNSGPSTATGATISDTLPGTISGATWTASGTGGAVFTASGSGSILETVNMPPGSSIIYTLSGTMASTATGSQSNTSTIAPPAGLVDPMPSNNSSTDTDVSSPTADLSIVKTDGSTTCAPGSSITYTITVRNEGPSDVSGARVSDMIPGTITGATWAATGTGGATFASSGSGNLNEEVDLPSGSTITYTVTGTVSESASGTLTNQATVTPPAGVNDPTPANNSSTDTDTLHPIADLSITKTDGSGTYTPGSSITYTLVAGNAGPSRATGATVRDMLPAVLTGATWTATGTGGAVFTPNGTGNIDTTVDLPPGSTITYTLRGTVSPSSSGNLANTATVAVPAGTTDPVPSNDTATDTDSASPVADLSITKTDGRASYVPGSSLVYTLVVSNAGPSSITGATVTDTLPAALSGSTWSATGTGGATFTPSGSGSINQTVNLPAGSSITYSISGTVSPSASGNLSNTATVSVPAGVTDSNPGNNSATDTDTQAFHVADLSITKTDGSDTYTPGYTVNWTIVCRNNGPDPVTGAILRDTLPEQVSGATWTATGTGGASIAASGTGSINQTVSMPVGSTITCTISGNIPNSATGNMVNTATIDVPAGVSDPNPSNNAATDADSPEASADLSITKSDGSPSYVAGSAITYTILVRNAGPADVLGATIEDVLPQAISGVTWTATGTGGAGFTASGAGDIHQSVRMPANSTLTYTIHGTVLASTSGSLRNTATVTPPEDTPDPVTGNNTATDEDVPDSRADLSITKTDGTDTYSRGGSVTYTLVANNAGPSDVAGATVVDVLPAALQNISWTAVGTPGSTYTPSGIGNLNQTIGLRAGSSVTYTVTGTVSQTASGDLVNRATISTPSGVTDTNPGDNTATDTDTRTLLPDLYVTKTATPDRTTPGGSIVYSLKVGNSGDASAAGVTLKDEIPDSTAFVSASDGGTLSGTTVLWNLGSLDAGTDRTVTLTVRVDPNAPDGLVIHNTRYSVQGDGISERSGEPVDTPVSSLGQAEATKVGMLLADNDADNEISGGDILRYIISFRNTTGSALRDLTFRDHPDPRTRLVEGSVIPTSGTVTRGNAAGDTSVEVVVGDCPENGFLTITFDVRIDLPLPSVTTQISNQGVFVAENMPATVTDDPSTAQEDDPTVLPVGSHPSLGAIKSVTLLADSDGDGFPSPADTLRYTIVLQNSGSRALSTVRIQDIPDGNSALIAGSVRTTSGDILSGNTAGDTLVTVATGELQPGTAATITFDVLILSPLPEGVDRIVNQGMARCPEIPVVLTDDPSTAEAPDPTIVRLVRKPSLHSEKTAILWNDVNGNGLPDAGDTLIYRVVISNEGNASAESVVFRDNPDPNTILIIGSVTVSRGQVIHGNQSGETSVEVSVGKIPQGGSATITYLSSIRNPLPDGVEHLSNLGVVTAPGIPGGTTDDPGTPGKDDPTVVVVIPEPALSASKEAALWRDEDGNGVVSPGDILLYTVTIRNTGNATAIHVLFADGPDSNLQILSGSVLTSLGTVTHGNSEGDAWISADLGDIQAGEQVSITFLCRIAKPLPAGVEQVSNQGLVSASGGVVVVTDDPTLPGRQDPTTTPVILQPGMDAFKTAVPVEDSNGDGVLGPGDELLYRILLRNTGNVPLTGTILTDTPDPNTELVAGSVETDHGTVETGNGDADTSVRVIVGTLPVGSEASVTFRVRIRAQLDASVHQVANQGLVSTDQIPHTPTDDPGTLPKGDPTVTIVGLNPAMTVTKMASVVGGTEGVAGPGEQVLYRVTVRNTGNIPLTDVVFTDAPDSHTEVVTGSVVTSRGTVEKGNHPDDRTVEVRLGTLPRGAEAFIDFLVRIHAELPPDLTRICNQGTATSRETGPVVSDDPVTQTTGDATCTHVFQVHLGKVDVHDPVACGDFIDYVITWANRSDHPLTGCRLVESYDPAVRFESASIHPDPGTDSVWTLGTLLPGQGGELHIRVRVVKASPFISSVLNVVTLLSDHGSWEAQARTTVLGCAP